MISRKFRHFSTTTIVYTSVLLCILIYLMVNISQRTGSIKELNHNGDSPSYNFENFDTKEKERSCTPKKNIVFLKTHKTGGSTLTNILNRYGDSRSLNFLLPRIGEDRLNWPWYFQNDSFYPMHGLSPNILSYHARYKRNTMGAVMPNNSVYVTILREPVKQFESSFSYLSLDKIFGMKNSKNPMEEFFKNPKDVLMNYVLTQDLCTNSKRVKVIKNSMFYDLGLESRYFDDETKIEESIKELDSEFDLVMITEYFDESLVLLKRLMCWDLNDIVYFSLKQRTKKSKYIIPKHLKDQIYAWNRADVKLYNYFNKTFWKKLNKLGQDFWDEVKLFKARKKYFKNLCLSRDRYLSRDFPETEETIQFKLRNDIPVVEQEICMRMTWDELQYLEYQRNVHASKVKRKKRKKNFLFELLTRIDTF